MTNRHLQLTVLILVQILSLSLLHAQTRRVPQNATSGLNGEWHCNAGFIQRDELCVAVADATDAEVREHLVSRSVSAYSGSCPCPFNRDRAGRRCGARSAYSRPGGASPMCYESDVTEAAVKQFRAKYPRKKLIGRGVEPYVGTPSIGRFALLVSLVTRKQVESKG